MIGSLLRKIPPFKGKQRLARFLFKSRIQESSNVIVNGKLNSIYKLPNISETVGFEIFVNGIYEPDTVYFIASKAEKGGVVVDIGINVGAISIPLSKVRHDLKIIGLEAAPWIFDYVETNVKLNQLSNIKLINKAVSNESHKRVEFYSPMDMYGKGSLAPVFTQESVMVETITLDDLASNEGVVIDFLKVDVEGFEASVFRGGKELLSDKLSPEIMFEFVDWAEELSGEAPGAAQSVLMDFGYNLYKFHDGKLGNRLQNRITKGGAMLFASKKALK
jgi:FkbM family methyltransferase